ncbi:MAG: phosphoglucomutase/phosphomannomutase family protein [Candidatus Omnitrophica bacterium]|nr:phosphoglucomutase/phosphomannomutase family protein [Candidatus Omnitrophota bacterium]
MKNPKDVIKFGTDGWRAVIADTFTFENVAILAQAMAVWVRKDAKKIPGEAVRVAIGYDNRFLSKDFSETVASVFAANGIEVILSNASLPTPALSLAARDLKCVAGVVITASHNPPEYNGFKIKTAEGGGAGKNITDAVEGYIATEAVKAVDFKKAVADGNIKVVDLKKDYLKFIKGYVNLKKIKAAKFRVCQDVMHGSGGTLLAEVLKGSTGIKLELLRSDVNPGFGNSRPEPLPQYLGGLIAKMKKEKIDLGLVLDGDADRIAAVLPGGEFLSPQKILALLALHLWKNRGIKGGVIKTICGTVMIDNMCKDKGIKLYETPVGFKYISDLMLSEEIITGGEEAGGMGLPNYIPERDGILAGLLLLEMMVYEKKNIGKILAEVEKAYGRYYYDKTSINLKEKVKTLDPVKKIEKVLGQKVVGVKDYDGVKLELADTSWIMVRASGTEPILRAYAESKSVKRTKELLNYALDLAKTL